ncbi:hypothetical protein H114_00662 [Streptomyces gancidicus BKS 13-15]|uniref:Uncharacterized protein n=1 Tax=Streptomyces gancidicus BKS 13-15 TaxID=1284664 RepID=M3DM82_STREZ|nr:hypothetical protein [Streptomyces gancidicus]EMF31095.1 hypothetical protein H114_00662 [Streptomyces gancidicus BKS 13-15]
MIEALDVLGDLLGEFLRWLWSLVWWWGSLLAAAAAAVAWYVLRPGTGRRRRPRSSAGEFADTDAMTLPVTAPPAEEADG